MIPGGDDRSSRRSLHDIQTRYAKADETTKGGKVVDEYEEFTARPDIDGKR